MGRRRQDACPGSTPYSSRVRRRLRRSATVCPDATACGHSRRPRAGRGARRRAHAGRRRTAAPPPSARSTSPRPSASWPGRRRRWPPCTSSPPSCSAAAAAPSASAWRRSRATRSSSTSGRRGAPRAAPSSRSSSRRPSCRARRSPSSGSTRATRRDPARRFLRATPLPFPSYVDPDEDIAKTIQAPANYPITVFFDRRGKLAYVHQGGYRRESDLVDDMTRYLS